MNRHGTTRRLVSGLLLALAGTVFVSGCAAGDATRPTDEGATGRATLALTVVPSDVNCLQVTVSGSRVDVRTFDVTPSEAATLTMNALPIGDVLFSEQAFAESCSSLTPDSVPTWVGEPVPATLTADSVTQVQATLVHNGQAVVTFDFQDDGAGGSDGGTQCTPIPFDVACAGAACNTQVSDGCGSAYLCGVCCIPLPLDVACGNAECGTVEDGCGGTYSCGTCPSDPCQTSTCQDNICVFTSLPACLVAGTPITMADRTMVPIERVRVGDEVLAYDVTTGRPRAQRVTRTFRHAAGENHEGMVLINGTIRATGNHPVYANGIWKRADELASGDSLIELGTGEAIDTATAIEMIEMLPGEEETFNLEVDGDHNYFAGGILVHNKITTCN